MTCQTCQRQSTAVTIGTSQYCALCGSRVEHVSAPAQVATPASTVKSLDMRRGGAPVVSARGRSARSLHATVKPGNGRTLDLRAPAVRTRPRGTVLLPEAFKATAPAAAPVAPTIRDTPVSSATTFQSPSVEIVTAPQHQAAAVSGVQPTGRPAAVTTPPRHREHHSSKTADRLKRAQAVEKSVHVSRFGNLGRLNPADAPVTTAHDSVSTPVTAPVHPTPELPAAAVTAHQSLRHYVATPNTAPVAHPPKWTHYATVAGAIAIMAGYVWVQNYPKLTIQAAANKAGVVATNPSYLPTSYNLTGTSAAPGLLTLNFKSPSQTTPLTIAQARTTWDAQSLADNVIAKTDSAYTSVSGQGLTIYLYGQNNAAWVNHGIWYTIKGTARLSRNEILKIAYGL